MVLTVDVAGRQRKEYQCECCAAPVQRVWSFIQRDRAAHAVYFANCYHHQDQPPEVWIDAILGSWGTDSFADHVTFGCRIEPVPDRPTPMASLVQACLDGTAAAIHGAVLSRERGLTHPRLPEFWEVVDCVLEHDPVVNAHLYRTPLA